MNKRIVVRWIFVAMLMAACLTLSPPRLTAQTPPPSSSGENEASRIDKIARALRMLDEAQNKWDEWQPRIKEMAARFQKKYEESNKWDYEVLNVEQMDSKAVAAKLTEMGEGGWECFESVKLTDGQCLLLRKRRGGILAQLPVREIMEMIFYQFLIPGTGS